MIKLSFSIFSVAILIHNVSRDVFVFVKQFRPGENTSLDNYCTDALVVATTSSVIKSLSLIHFKYSEVNEHNFLT